MDKGKIVVVDDDTFFMNLHMEILTKAGYDVLAASSGREALDMVEAEKVDVVVTDLMMPDINGQEVLERTKQHDALIDVIVVTGHGTVESAIAAMKSGAFDYIRKPINHEELVLSVERCIEQKMLVQENKGLKQSLKLFEVSRTITSCLEIDKLYNLSLDALLQEIPGDSGICLFYGSDGISLEIKAARNIGQVAAKKVTGLFMEKCENEPMPVESVSILDIRELGGKNINVVSAFNSIIAAPLRRGKTAVGFLMILSELDKDEYRICDMKNAAFIAEQASFSFENAAKYTKAKEMAFVDSLTDLYNPRFLDVVIDKEIKRSSRTKIPFTVLFMDLDHFKRVNDVHGHLVGSKVLIEVSGILLKCVREVDTVIRYGGDEYTIILVDTDYDAAYGVAERIRKSIESHKFLSSDNLSLNITTSVGLATFPSHAKDKKDLLDMADRAMYYGKNRSRNAVYMATDLDKGEAH